MTSGAGDELRTTRNSGGVQSIERVFELLETMADAGGVIGHGDSRPGEAATQDDGRGPGQRPREPGRAA